MSKQPEIITIQDARRAGMCVHGLRQWFERHGLDFRAFLDHGIEADKLAATGDAGALRVIEITRKGAL